MLIRINPYAPIFNKIPAKSNEGLPGSAEFVSEDLQGGYFVEFDDPGDE